MRNNWPATFVTELNRPGCCPYWVLLINANNAIYCLSDNNRVIAPWSDTQAYGVIESWGSMREGSGNGTLAGYNVSESTINVLANRTIAANGTTINALADGGYLDEAQADLYLGLAGISDQPQLISPGYIRDFGAQTDLVLPLIIQDKTIVLENSYVGNKVDTVTYSHAAKSDVGKMIPIPFGTIGKVPAVCLETGWITSISDDIADAYATTVGVSEFPSYSVVGLTVFVDSEQITITAVDPTNKIITFTRGANYTTPTFHNYGTAIVEKRANPMVFCFSDLAVTSLGTVYGRYQGVDVDISAYVTKYTGAAGNQYSSYGSKALITIGSNPQLLKNLLLALENGLNVSQGNHQHSSSSNTTITFDTATADSTSDFQSGHDQTKLNDGDTSTYTQSGGTGFFYSYRHNAVLSNSGTPLSMRLVLVYAVPYNSYGYSAGTVTIYIKGSAVETVNLGTSVVAKTTIYSGWHAISAWTDVSASTTKAKFSCNSLPQLYEAYWEIQTGTASAYSAAAGVALTGDLSLTGGSVTGSICLDAVLCDVTNNNQTGPTGIANWLLAQRGLPNIQTVGNLTTTTFNGLINDYQTYLYWLNKLAFECGCWFMMPTGQPKFVSRQKTAAVATIPECLADDKGVRSLTTTRTALGDKLEKIIVLYARDWSQSKSDSAYTASTAPATAGAGTREQPELFQFDFVTDSGSAVAAQTRYLAQQSTRHNIRAFDTGINQAMIESGDTITIAFTNEVGIVIPAELTPGNYSQADAVKLTVLV